MNTRDIFIVARYEALVISRGIVFRLLALLALLGITCMQVVLQGSGMAYSWTMVATSSAMPLVNAYLFNIVQAFMIVFLVTDFNIREKRRGFLECIHARPISNANYFFGKVTAILWIFFCFSAVSVVLCSAINLFASEAPWNPLIYLFYFLTLTLPSLLFFTGLSFFVTLLSRSRFLAQVILLVVFYFTVTRLPGICHGCFDFMGSSLPNLFSEITGHSGWSDYLFQRFSFLLVGSGLICLSVGLTRRLPNRVRDLFCWRRVGILVIVAGCLCTCGRLYSYWHTDAMREAYRCSYDRYWNDYTCRVREHRIRFHREADRLTSVSDMLLYNPGDVGLPQVVLFLNPGLGVSCVREGGRELKFRREHQVLLIERELGRKDSTRLEITYSGRIDESYCYLSISDERYYNPWREDAFFNFGTRYAYMSDEFTWLVPECGWYPVAIPDNPRMTGESGRDYTRYELEVESPPRQTVLSQGEVHRKNDMWRFQTPRPLEGISLCIGDYECKRVQTSGFIAELYMFRKSRFDSSFFRKLKKNDAREVLEKSIGRARALTGSTLSFADSISEVRFRGDWCYSRESRLIVAELPLPITSFYDMMKNRSAWVQPGMIFYPERGARGVFVDAPKQYKRKYLKRFENSERKLEKDMFKRLVSVALFRRRWRDFENPFLRRVFGRRRGHENFSLDKNLCSSYTLMYEPGVYLSSGDYPLMDAFYKECVWQKFTLGTWMSRGMAGGEKQEMITYARRHSLSDAMKDAKLDPLVLGFYWEWKVRELLDMMCCQVSRDSLWDFFDGFYRRYSGEVPTETFLRELKDSLGVTVEGYRNWFEACPQNMYRVKDLGITKVQDKESGKSFGEFKIQHCGSSRGVISVTTPNLFVGGKMDYDVYRLEPGKCYQVRFPMDGKWCFALNLNITRNMPTEIYVELGRNADNKVVYNWGKDTCCGVFEIDSLVFDEVNDDVIVVDNESPDFRLIYPHKKWLQRLFTRNDKEYIEHVSFPRVVGTWNKMYAGWYFGDSVRSVYGKLSEKGVFKAEWKTEIRKGGMYEIFVLIHNTDEYYRRRDMKLDYFYSVEGENYKKEVCLYLDARQKGWVSLGVHDIPEGEARIVLDDRGNPEQIVIADAVKWVKVE